MNELVELLKKYLNRKNLITDFVTLTKESGIDQRFAGTRNLCLTKQDILEICDGSDKMIEKWQEAIAKARDEANKI